GRTITPAVAKQVSGLGCGKLPQTDLTAAINSVHGGRESALRGVHERPQMCPQTGRWIGWTHARKQRCCASWIRGFPKRDSRSRFVALSWTLHDWTWRQWGCARFLRPWRERRAFGPKRRLARNQDRRRSEWFGTSSRRTGSCCGRSRSRSSLRASGPFHAAADNSPGEAFGLDDHEIARCVTAGSASAGFSLQFLQNAYMRVTSAGGRVRILAGLRYSGI